MTKLILLLLFHLTLLNITAFTAWPEMLSYPYLLSKGFVLYKDFIYPYPPLLTIILYSVFGLFGYSIITLKIFTWGLIILTDIVLYLILKKITKENIALLFLFIYIPLQTFLDGNMLWFDYATVLPLLIAYLLIIDWIKTRDLKKLFFIGIALAAAISIKQVSIFYALVFIIFYFAFINKKNIQEDSIGLFGGFIYSLPFIVYIFLTGSFKEFWLWTTYYPLTEWSKFPGYVALKISLREAITLILLFTPTLGTLLNYKNTFKDKTYLLSLGFLIAAIIAIYPRFSLFHFQPALTFLIITSTIIFSNFKSHLKSIYLGVILITSLLVISLVPKDFSNHVRFYSEQDKMLSNKIAEEVAPGEVIFLLGPISSQYVFTNTIPPKHWSDNFGWYLEIPGVQEWVLRGFEETPPEKIFRQIPADGNWYDLGTYQPQKIVDYIQTNYDNILIINNNLQVWIIKK